MLRKFAEEAGAKTERVVELFARLRTRVARARAAFLRDYPAPAAPSVLSLLDLDAGSAAAEEAAAAHRLDVVEHEALLTMHLLAHGLPELQRAAALLGLIVAAGEPLLQTRAAGFLRARALTLPDVVAVLSEQLALMDAQAAREREGRVARRTVLENVVAALAAVVDEAAAREARIAEEAAAQR